jgi:RimJ/RimL family protein N-acetyltransferase
MMTNDNMPGSAKERPRAELSQYFLRTPRLGFRWWQATELNLARSLWGDPEVTRLIGGPFTPEQVRARLEQEIAGATANGIQYWPIFLLSNDDFAGCCGLRPYRPAEEILEIGFHLRRNHWGNGYASEAAQAVIDYAFSSLAAKALFAGHHPANETSKRLLEKLGFRYVGDEHYAPTGLMHPSYLLAREDRAA